MNYVHNKTADAPRFVSPRAAEVPVPEEDREDDPMEDERDGGSQNPHEDADFGFDHAALPRLSDGALESAGFTGSFHQRAGRAEQHDRP